MFYTFVHILYVYTYIIPQNDHEGQIKHFKK